MKELKISPDFTIDDIHKIREYNYEMMKDMSPEERKQYNKQREQHAREVKSHIDEMRKQKLQQA